MKRPSSFCIISLTVFVLSCLSVSASFSEEAKPEEFSLALDKCIELALENNLDVQALKINPEISKINYEIAQTIFDPVFRAGASRSVSNRQGVTFISITGQEADDYSVSLDGNVVTGGSYSVSLDAARSFLTAGFPIEFNPSYTSGLNLSFWQPLLRDFGREVTKYNIIVAQNSYEISTSAFSRTVIDTVAATEQAYWGLVGARDYLWVQRESLKLAQDQLEQNRIMVKVGTKAPIDITEAEATVAQRVLDVINAENLVRTTEDNLRAILNIAPGTDYWTADIIPTDKPSFETLTVDLDESIKTAMTKRPELKEADIYLRTYELDMRYQKNQSLPQLDVGGGYGLSGVSGETLPGPDGLFGTSDDIKVQEGISGAFDDLKDANYTNWNLGLNFSIPIMNRAAAKRYVISKLNYDKANIQYKSLEEKIAIEVKDAVRAVEMNIKKLDAAKASRILNKERLNAIQKKFDNGMATNFEVSEYQQYLAAAATDEIQALIAYNIALMSLEKAKGNLLESRGIVLESFEQ